MSKILNRPLDIYVNANDKHSLAVNGITVIDTKGSVKNVGGNGYFTVAVKTNGTSAVNVFSAAGAPVALTVTSVVSIAQDTTAGNITLSQASNTVATIAKGTTSGALVGGASLAHTSYAAGDACQVLSSSAGNSIVVITFQVV